jgi:hypothetical protein
MPSFDRLVRPRAGGYLIASLLLVSTFSCAPAPQHELGVFPCSAQVQRVQSFGNWLGRRPTIVTEFLSRRSWETITNVDWVAKAWAGRPWRLSLTVPMLPDQAASLEAGARGEYDHWFRTLARRLVAAGLGDSILRVGHEFNGDWMPWRAAADPRAFVAYWRRLVAAMRSVAGEAFLFDWNPNLGQQEIDASSVYPGNDVVDYVGLTIYDVSYVPDTYPYPDGASSAERLRRQQLAWERKESGPRGLDYWASFARDHGKRLSVPEWGLVGGNPRGGGDDPAFVRYVHRFLGEHDVAYFSYFDCNGGLGRHVLRSSDFPQASVVFRDLFGTP